MRRLVALVVLALLVAGTVTWVDAFSGASARSTGALTVVRSDTALLAVGPCEDSCDANKTGIAYFQSGGTQLLLDFRKGATGGTTFGVQAGATYTFKRLVWVTNNAGRAVDVTTNVTGGSPDLVWVRDQNSRTLVGSGAGAVTVPAGGRLELDFRWQGNSTAGTQRALQMTVSAR